MIRDQLQNPANLRDLLVAVVPELAPRFDFSQIEQLSREFILDDWRRRESDVLVQLPYQADEATQPVLVCVLIEHQSRPDPRMPLRMLLYTVLYWDQEWKAWEESSRPRRVFRLNPVLPIVFHTGRSVWRTYKDLGDLIAGPDVLKAFVPEWTPLFWDLAAQPVEALLNSAGKWQQALAVIRAERQDRTGFHRILREALWRMGPLGSEDRMRWHSMVEFALTYAIARRPVEERDDLVALARDSQFDVALQQEVVKVTQTIAEALRAEGIEKGIEKGIEEGRAVGQLEGQLRATRDNLRLLLEDRFGALPEELSEKIEGATDLDRLSSAVRQVLRINSADELQL